MGFISLGATDLAIAAGLVLALAGLSLWSSLGLTRSILVAATRTTIQLLLVGFVLRTLFQSEGLLWLVAIAMVMLLAAGREVRARQARPLAGAWGFSVGALSMFISSFSITVFALVAVIGATPWHQPQYAIPLLGMLLGNTMNGVALGTGRFTEVAYREKRVLEGRLLLGQSREEATLDLRRESVRTGMVPILNSMAAAGLVSLPGDDDRADPRGKPAGRSGEVSDLDHVSRRGGYGLRGFRVGRVDGAASFRRAPSAPSGPSAHDPGPLRS